MFKIKQRHLTESNEIISMVFNYLGEQFSKGHVPLF